MKNIILYGAGSFGEKYLHFLKERRVKPLCFIDKDIKKQGTKIDDISIISLKEAKELYEDFSILITPLSPSVKEEIKGELIGEGIQEEDIINTDTNEMEKYKNLCLTTLAIFTPSVTEIENKTQTSFELSNRISHMYQKLYNVSVGDGMWEGINNMKQDVHNILLDGDVETISKILSDPGKTNLFMGFDGIYCYEEAAKSDKIINTEMVMLHRIGEIWGISHIMNPESNYLDFIGNIPLSYVDIDYIIEGLNRLFKCDIQFPNPYLGERGVEVVTSAGRQVACFRALQSLHQAFLIWEKLGKKPGKVVEIGAGIGRTAYYCKKLFNIDYTIVDLAITQVASSHFLAQTLGEDAICLYGELYSDGQIQFLPPHIFLEQQLERYDMVVNFDSLTEMDFSTMKSYWNKIKKSTKAFLSVNHEVNEHTVRELVHGDPAVKTYNRSLYDMRVGYAQEYMTF